MKGLKTITIVASVLAALVLAGCAGKTDKSAVKSPVTNVIHPDWTADAVIYEVNVRQYTKEGTFKAFDAHLSRLQELGVDILWFMPVYPIGEVERKGELGSYYSIRDYKAINPEFGTIEDFKATVDKAHELGFKVILDWVANHTSRDHEWIEQHPDWYVMDDSTGTPVAPFDWTDVAELNYDNPDMRAAMLDAMTYWVKEVGVDGFRCDVAHEVPVDFWNATVKALRQIRPDLFMLAESEEPALMTDAFDAYYGWSNHAYMNKLAQGKATASEYAAYVVEHEGKLPVESIEMNFTSNHDENSWNGTEFERMGDAARQFAVLTFVEPGMPLIYSGQEMGNDNSLEFFMRDPIVWEDPQGYTQFYKELIAMRDAHPSMYAPRAGAPMKLVANNLPEKVFSFERRLADGSDGFTAIFNFSAEEVGVGITEGRLSGQVYRLPAHGYKIVFDSEIKTDENEE